MTSGYIKIVNGDILDSTETYIAHQCNCVSMDAKGIAKVIFDKYPYADTYSKRTKHNIPGTIHICKNIINMYAQYYPTVAKYTNDSSTIRIEWFKQCLNVIAKIPQIQTKTIAMPYNIGCGFGGGDWAVYYAMIKEFATNNKIHVTLYKLD